MVQQKNLTPITISTDRLNHILEVARKMKTYASKVGLNSEDMFILGFLHDIGYEFSVNKEDHPTVGGILLKDNNYKYHKEVFYHGKVQDEYHSLELDLLNYCDMTTSPKGEDMTIEERLSDIKDRYGETNVYFDAKYICDKVSYIGDLIK